MVTKSSLCLLLLACAFINAPTAQAIRNPTSDKDLLPGTREG